MLKTRIITAVFIALGTFVVVFLLPSWGFRYAMAVLWILGTWEFTRLAGLGRFTRWILLVLQAILLAFMTLHWDDIASHARAFMVAATLSWCIMFLRLLTFRPNAQPGLNYRLVSFFCAIASISFAWLALAWLRDQEKGEFLVLLVLVIIWAADTGAYFAGRAFGRNKLAPQISPGKTREGLIGGLALALAAAFAVAALTGLLPAATAPFAVVTLITALTSAGGDLFISLHKRTVGLKDTGNMFPGHGGVLDRFDSLMAAAPFFALGNLFLGL